jgi:hypothetical protein
LRVIAREKLEIVVSASAFWRVGRKVVRSLPFRQPSPLIKSVRIFSNTHRVKSMKIFIKVKPKASQAKVVKIGTRHYQIYVTQPPEKGKANKKTQK